MPFFQDILAAFIGADLNGETPGFGPVTIAPSNFIHQITGTGVLRTITPPPSFAAVGGGMFVALPTGAFSWDVAGNIAVLGNAVPGVPILWFYSAATSLWYPIAPASFGSGEITFPGAGILNAAGGQISAYSNNGLSYFIVSQLNMYLALNSQFAQLQASAPDGTDPITYPVQVSPAQLTGEIPGPINLGGPVAPFPVSNIGRLIGKGTPLVAANFVLGSGWGSSASVAVTQGDDSRWQIVITSGGTGQAPNPTIEVAVQDGAWPTAPIMLAQLVNASSSLDLGAPITVVTTDLRATLTAILTPVVGRTYTIAAIVAPYDPTQRSDAPNVPDVPNITTTPPASKTIMPLGDSITLGVPTNSSGWRLPLYKKFVEAGVSFTYVGTLQDGPPSLPNTHHNGYSGFNIADIISILSMLLTNDPNPDYILLSIGTNDVGTGYSAALAELGTLLDNIISGTSTTKILVAQVPPQAPSIDSSFVVPFNAGIPALVSARSSRCALVDLYSPMNYSTDFQDTLHPNMQGYQKMANTWWNALC